MTYEVDSSILSGGLIVCPECYSILIRLDDGCLRCTGCATLYPKRASVDVFLAEEEWRECLLKIQRNAEQLKRYCYARRNSLMNIIYNDWWVHRMLSEIPEDNDGPLLELMCGEGEITRRLPSKFTRIVALDLNVDMVERAVKELSNSSNRRVTMVCGNATRIPISNKSVNAVLIQGGMHHIKPLLTKVLSEIYRILKPGGVLVCSEPANDSRIIAMIRRSQYIISEFQGNDIGEDGFTKQELSLTLSAYGFTLDRYHQFGFLAYPLMGNIDILNILPGRNSWRWLGNFLLKLDQFFEEVPIIKDMGFASIFRAFKEVS